MPMTLSIRLALLLALCGANAAYARDCNQAATQAEMNGCAAQALSQADAELNQTYLAYRAKLRPSQQNQLRDVQLAWIKYRDLSCRFESANASGGSAGGMVLQNCLADKTRQRAGELQALSGCPEGDIACVR